MHVTLHIHVKCTRACLTERSDSIITQIVELKVQFTADHSKTLHFLTAVSIAHLSPTLKNDDVLCYESFNTRMNVLQEKSNTKRSCDWLNLII